MLQTLKVIQTGQVVQFQSKDGLPSSKRTVIMQEIGGDKADTFAVTLLGAQAQSPLAPGDVVCISLRFQAREYEGKFFQDCLGRDFFIIASNQTF